MSIVGVPSARRGSQGPSAVLHPRTWQAKLVVVPAGASPALEPSHVDNAMVKALARAFRWRKILEIGTYATIEELAAAEKINSSYVSRILRMTLLTPHIIEQILHARHTEDLTRSTITKPFPLAWNAQRTAFAPVPTTPTGTGTATNQSHAEATISCGSSSPLMANRRLPARSSRKDEEQH